MMDMIGMLAERRAVQRRNALRTLGLGVTALAAGTVTADAKRKGKGKANQKPKDRCPSQVAACEAALAEFCADPQFQEECLASTRECCAPLKTCNAGAAMDCFVFRFLTA